MDKWEIDAQGMDNFNKLNSISNEELIASIEYHKELIAYFKARGIHWGLVIIALQQELYNLEQMILHRTYNS